MSASIHHFHVSGAWKGMLVSGGLILLTLGGTAVSAIGGDLLRGGYNANSSQSANPTSFTPPSVTEARANATDTLARATQVVQAVRQMQSQARSIAAAAGKSSLGINPNNPSQQLPNVPNGLGAGGLYPTGGVAQTPSGWTGVKSLTQSQTGGNTTVTVTQDSPDAVLTWTSFNIGSATTLQFNQSAGGKDVGNWIAFNEILDPTGVPSQILGSIKAQGQVYVINQNGIIFGGASQVNVHALVASSLPINGNLIASGLANNPDDQFLFSSIAIPSISSNAPAFNPPPAPNGKSGDVTVEAGAVLESPASADNVGGKIALVGPNVTNAGTIITPDGQTILAAGQQVAFLPHAESDPSLRGLDVYVGQGGGTAINSSDIQAPEADVTIAGASVQQLGSIESTTSVTLNGRIDLDADYGSVVVQIPGQTTKLTPTETGNVTLGNGSITEILPEWDSSETVTGNALALTSQVNIQGETIHMAGDAEVLAPNATVSMKAGTWLPIGSGNYQFEYTEGQIYLDSGASIDVAGSEDVNASVTQNIVAAQLLGPELADSPLQRNGDLRGQTIYIDIRDQGIYDGVAWIGTPLANVSGYAALIPYTVGELTTNGGTVSMQAGGSVVMQKGSEVNVSGGWINYAGGIVTTTDLISGGHIYNISQATPDLVYGGFLPQFNMVSAKWGVSATYDDPLITTTHYENSYVYGGNGGTVTITAPSTALDGNLLGLTANGPRQLSVQAAPSAVTIAFEGQNGSLPTYPADSPTPPAVVFSTQDNLPAAAPFTVDTSGNPAALGAELTEKVILSPDLLTSDGFGNLTVRDGDGSVTVPAGVTLNAGPGGSVTFTAANMDIAGSIVAPGGAINLTTYDYSPYTYQYLTNTNALNATPAPDPSRGKFVLGSGATLDVSGLLIDDRAGSPDADTTPLETAGGAVSIASYSANLEAGSIINVSGGVELTTNGTPQYGAAGRISILAGNDPDIPSLVGGSLVLNATLEGFSGARGGALTVQTPQIQIGGATAAGVLQLAPGFFDQGGFGSFTLEALGADGKSDKALPSILIAPGTIIAPVAESLVAVPYSPDAGGLKVEPVLLPVGSRTPVSLTLDAEGEKLITGDTSIAGSLVMGPGAVITTDPLGSVSLIGQTVSILGSIFAPGGSVNISGGDTVAAYGNFGSAQGQEVALPTVYISPQTVISTAGTTILTPNNKGYITGSVTTGGAINISGNIAAEAGAVFNVSGASNILDESPIYSNISLGLNGAASDPALQTSMNGSFKGALLVPTLIESNAGSITLKGTEELFTDATLVGQPGGGQALGGTLTVSSGVLNTNPGNPLAPSVVSLIVTESGLTIGNAALGSAVLNANGAVAAQLGHIAVQSFGGGGFDSINLNGSVEFSGPVNITAARSISVASGGFLYGDGAISLTAPYVALGTGFEAPTPVDETAQDFPIQFNGVPYSLAPTYGTGSLTVTAQLIDVGNLSLQSVGAVNLIANNGAIQGDGSLDVAGSISMRAAQIYPPTETTFTIAAYDYTDANGKSQQGSVTIIGSGEQQLPLSAGGILNIYASNITQDGVLRAPFGTINLGWDGVGTAPVDPLSGKSEDATQNVVLGNGSITSVSAIDPLTGEGVTIPYGTLLNGISWIDPSGVDITSVGAPQKVINISGKQVTEAKGATIDIRGGGDLFAYRFVSGIGGDTDILDTNSSYAIIPGYSANYASYAPFNPDRPSGSTELANLGTDPGYVNGQLAPGDTIYLAASSGLPAGTYTLLPARYATMPGAYLVTPLGGSPGGSGLQPDGSSIVAGYRIGTGQAVVSNYEVETPAIVKAEAEYDTFSGTVFLGDNSNARTPADSGQLILQATQGMSLEGAVISRPLDAAAQGGLVEISSPADIFIAGAGQSSNAPAGDLVLDAVQLSSIGAQSLLIGGIANGTAVTVTTNNLTVDNAGTALSGGDIILAANDSVTLDQGATITAAGSSGGAATLTLSGNGALLRVSSDSSAQIVRTGVDSTTPASLVVGQNVKLTGASVILDSSDSSTLDPSAKLNAKAVTIDSGAISIVLSDGNGATPGGLILSGNALQQIQSHASTLTLLSYSSIDIYGAGQIGSSGGTGGLDSLTLSANEIDGFDQTGGTATFAARNITLNGGSSGATPGAAGAVDGSLVFDGGVIHLGSNALAINQYTNVQLNGANGIIAGETGSITIQNGLTMTAPLITGAAGAQETIAAGGAVTIAGESSKAAFTGGLAASLSITGASIGDNGDISLPSGTITLHATTGDVTIGNSTKTDLSVAGAAVSIFDLTKYTSGGAINLTADQGSVTVGPNGTINVSAPVGGGEAGSLNVTAPQGSFISNGALLAQYGVGGNFSLRVNALPDLSTLGTILSTSGFTQAVQIRVDTGDVDVDGDIVAHQFDLSADQGGIIVTGIINASGVTGGGITLAAAGSVTLDDGAVLNAAGQKFDDAGKGGSVTLSAGADVNGNASTTAVVDVGTGSTINLSVAANNANSAGLGDFAGTLLIRAPQTLAGTDVQVAPVAGTITGASAIVVEGYRIYVPAGGQITSQLETEIYNDGVNFLGAAGVTTANYTAMLNRLTGNSGLTINIETGAEIIDPSGNLTLGTPTSNASQDWDLQNYRFGPNGTAGQLTMRASGNLVFYNTLSDGFDYTQSASGLGYDAPLLAQNTALPANIQSWSYTLTAGADMSAADPSQIIAGSGSVEVGKNDPAPYANGISTGPAGQDAQTEDILDGYYQVIRTGAGNIQISAGYNVELLNQFATIYTAGTQVVNPTLGGAFDVPAQASMGAGDSSYGYLGLAQEPLTYPAQYSDAGGNVTISAVNDITHLTEKASGQLVEDSEKELPNNWLYRRGYINGSGVSGISKYGDNASTTWWVDFSNFFEGVGALGGGNVTLTAGHGVANVDAVAPTNARMPMGTPSAAALVELGGGDVTVTAGDDINAGVYYVERGEGTLTAGNDILTNSTRSATLGNLTSPAVVDSEDAWLPTTLFLGTGSFTVTAGDNLLLGPVGNVFLLPEGISNTYWYKSYFSTYGAGDAVDVTSLAGSITLRESATPDGETGAIPLLETWLSNVDLYSANANTVSNFQPWLRLDETDVSDFQTATSLLPATLEVAALAGNVNIVGNLTLSPSPTGTLDLAAAGAINAVQPTGIGSISTGVLATAWDSSTIIVSDASPDAMPGVDDPIAYETIVGTSRRSNAWVTGQDLLNAIDLLFEESGQTNDALETKQELHGTSSNGESLHADDTTPDRVYAKSGNISGLTLYSPKETRVIAGANLTDISLYLQNNASDNISVVSAGGDIIAYDPASPLRTEAQLAGNFLESAGSPNEGDIQISGPGTLEVLAGNNLDLGVGPNGLEPGVGVGITSIGNQRNPYLPQSGADIIAAAGMGPVTDLSGSQLDFSAFISQFVTGAAGATYLSELSTIATGLPSFSGAASFDKLAPEEQDFIALDVFYLLLRDAGRDHNLTGSPGFGTYGVADQAIAELFPHAGESGDMSLTSREITTENGGNISIVDPSGQLTVGFDITGNQPLDQGIFTQDGGNISIFTNGSIVVGTSRIFTLRGGNEILWSTTGDIAAGESPKTVQEAPPTQVIVDPQSANVQTDLGGLATGGGIGVLASVQGVPAGNVDLIAPDGTVDAGDAGIRVTGNLNIAAVRVLNTANIQVGGASAGVPVAVVVVPNIAGLTAAANSAGAGAAAATTQAAATGQSSDSNDTMPSIATVEVIGYGGGDSD